jgi:quercetin dioxygenase-like cupin family protein
MKLLHFRGANLPKSSVEYFVKDGEVPRTQFGSATIMPGGRLPSESYSQHDWHSEISYVISGSCRFHADGEVIVLREGDVLYNPKGTKHFVESPDGKPCVMRRIATVLQPALFLGRTLVAVGLAVRYSQRRVHVRLHLCELP